jgi:hypothetical protein
MDPTARHRVRYHDGNQWTAWIADDGPAQIDPEGATGAASAERRARHRRATRTGLIILATGVLGVGAVLLFFWLVQSSGEHTAHQFATELDQWRLPRTVKRSAIPDKINPGELAQSTPSLVRYYEPTAGATTRAAAEDLVAALRDQGYPDLYTFDGGDYVSTNCKSKIPHGCDIGITIEEKRERILVEVVQ